MSVDPNLPGQHGELVTPDFRPTRWWYDWFRRVHARLVATEATATAASEAVAAIPASNPTIINPSGTIGVYGDPDTGYTLEVSDEVLALGRVPGPPGRDGEDGADSYVPGPKGDKGDTGPAGSGGGGMTIIVQEDHYDDVWPFPGPKGDTGAAGGGGGSGYSEGTSFPGSPSNNDKYFRTDLDKLCFYDGTRWLTVAEFPVAGTQYSSPPFSSTNTGHTRYSVPSAANLYLTRVTMYLYVLTTSSGTQYWTFNLYQYTSAEAQIGGTLGTASTISQAANTIVRNDVTLNVALDSTARAFYPIFTKVSTPGNLYPAYTIWAREIIT